jgi:hypothetical protein
MGIVIQLALAAIAFFRGWRWYALIPLAVVFCLGFLSGAAGHAQDMAGALVMFDLLGMVALAVMCIWVHPKIKERNEAIKTAIDETKKKFS